MAAQAVEFPGPVSLPQDGASLAVTRVRLPAADRDYFVTGSGGGFLNLNRFNPFNGFFTVLQRLHLGGEVSAVVPWQGVDAPAVGLVVATRNPDRVLRLQVNGDFPYLEVLAEVALEEDPGGLAFVGNVPAGPMELAVSLPGVDRVVFLGDRAGVWSVVSETATGDGPASLVGVDLDGDGVRELVVAQSGPLSGTLGILRRAPDGTYPLTTVTLPGVAPGLVAAHDLDGDGRLELAVAVAGVPEVVFYADAAGSLQEVNRATLTFTAQTIHLVELADGAPGLFVARAERGLLEFAGLYGGQWQRIDTYYPGCRPHDFGFVDLDGDGLDDLISVGGSGNVLTGMLGDGRPGFAGFPALSLDRNPGSFVSEDIDGDGREDLLLSDANQTTLSLSRGLPDGSLSHTPVSLELDFTPGYILAVELDGDPGLELAVLDIVAADLVLLDLSPTFVLTVLSRNPVGSFPHFIDAGDLDGDQFVDLVVLTQDTPEVAVLYGAGDGTVSETVRVGFDNPARRIVPLDLDADGLLDLAAADGISRVWTRTNTNGRQFDNQSFVNAGSGAIYLATGDLDGDLDDDLVVVNRSENTLSFLENDGSGFLVRRIGGHALPGQPAGMVLADFDLDGRLDVLLNLQSEEALGLVFGVGDWSYSLTEEYQGGPDMAGIDTADFNLDGVPDILALDRSLLLGLTLLNGDPGQVAVAPTALTGGCRDGRWELRVKPDRPGPWRLELKREDRWQVVMADGQALIGERDYDAGTWTLRLDPTEVALFTVPGGSGLLARLSIGAGADREDQVWTLSGGCGVAPDLSLPRVRWQNEPWPNPFNPSVRARIRLERGGPLRVAVYDLAGRQVAVLASGEFPSGSYEVRWDGLADGRPAAAGLYLMRVEAPGVRLQRKLMLIK